MKILHVINSLGSGGAENLINNILPIMSNSNEVELLILTKENNLYYEELSKKIKIHISPYKGVRNLKHIKYIRKIIKSGNYDIVHGHLFPVQYFLPISLMGLKNKPKLIFTEHNTTNNRRRFGFKIIENFIYKKYDKIITISEGTDYNLKKWLYSKYHNKLKKIENGIPLNKFKNAQPYNPKAIVHNYQTKDVLLLMVGSFSEQKDQNTIIRSLKLLPNNYKLILVGEGSLKKDSIQLTQELKLEERVFFLGVRNDVDRITKTADICIVSSHWEGFGLVAVEGMAAGKPIIASNVLGLNKIVNNEDYLFNIGDEIELAKKIKCILNEKKLEKAIDYFKKESKKYDVENMINKYLKEYQKTIKGIE